MTNLKILHIVSSYWPAFKMGGPIQSVHLMNKFLIKRGVNVAVFTTNAGLEGDKNIKFGIEENIDGVKIFRFPYYGYINFSFSPKLFFEIGKRIKNFDIAHISEIWNFSSFALLFWAKFYKIPYVISPRGSLMVEPLNKKSHLKKKLFLFLFVKSFLKNAAVIHFTAEIEKEEYLKAGLPLKNNFAIIPNGIDFKDFDDGEKEAINLNFKKDLGITPDKKIILSLGRIDWKKGFDTLIPAFVEAVKKNSSLLLLVVGPESDYKKTVEDLINAAGIKDKVIFTGVLDGIKRIAAFKSSDVFVLPSYAENFGMVVAEAMYLRLPVIITKNVGLAPEIIKSDSGLVIEKNEKELTEAILKIINNPDAAKKMGEQGRELVKREFSPLIVADKILKLYNDICR
ncbi:MAG: glycosyltransferase [Candidatus Paceibacterota bacterium]